MDYYAAFYYIHLRPRFCFQICVTAATWRTIYFYHESSDGVARARNVPA